MSPKVYCVNRHCPLTRCRKHSSHIPEFTNQVSLVNLADICSSYKAYLKELEEETNEMDIRKEN